MGKKPDFTKIEQFLVAASLGYLVGYLMKIADTLQGYFTSFGISIPKPVIVVIVTTLLALILLRIVAYLWDKVSNIPNWARAPSKRNLHLYSGRRFGNTFTLQFLSTEWRYPFSRNDVSVNIPTSGSGNTLYGRNLTWTKYNTSQAITISRLKFYEVTFLEVDASENKFQIITEPRQQMSWGIGKYTFEIQLVSHVFVKDNQKVQDRVLYVVIDYQGGYKMNIKVIMKKPKKFMKLDW